MKKKKKSMQRKTKHKIRQIGIFEENKNALTVVMQKNNNYKIRFFLVVFTQTTFAISVLK